MFRTKQEKQNQSVLTLLFNICITFSFRIRFPKGPIWKSTLDILFHFLVQNHESDKSRETFSIEKPSQPFHLQYLNCGQQIVLAKYLLQVFVHHYKYICLLQSENWELPNKHFDPLRDLETPVKISYLVTIVNHS